MSASDAEEAEALLPANQQEDVGVRERAAKAFRAFLCYSLASEVFSVVSAALFLPIALEQYARDNGTFAPEHTISCRSGQAFAPGEDDLRCQARILGRYIDTSAFALWTFSFAVGLQALLVITLGASADEPAFRKRMLATTAFIGSVASILFFFISSESSVWAVASPLAVLANIGFGISLVALNAYLPSIGRGLAASKDPADIAKSTARVSARGIAIGYLSGCFVLALSLIPVFATHGSTLGMRIAVGASGVWWLVLSLFAVYLMPNSIFPVRRSPPKEGDSDWLRGWKGLWRMLKEIKRLPQTFIYLLAWLMLSDAFTTVTSTAILFAKTVLHMGAAQLVVIGIISPAAGIAGALLSPRLARARNLSNLQTLVALVSLALLVPLYGCLGFLPFVQRLGFGGLTAAWELYIAAAYFGGVYGAFQSFSRAVFSSLIPSNQSARWFGLYSITDKTASLFGPAIVGVLVETTGSLRLAFAFLVVALAIPIPVLAFWLDAGKGSSDAERYALEEDGT